MGLFPDLIPAVFVQYCLRCHFLLLLTLLPELSVLLIGFRYYYLLMLSYCYLKMLNLVALRLIVTFLKNLKIDDVFLPLVIFSRAVHIVEKEALLKFLGSVMI